MTDAYEHLDSQLDGFRAEAASLRNTYDAQVTAINRDPLLSDQGRQQEIDKYKDSAQRQLTAVRAREDLTIKDTLTSLERSIFGHTIGANPAEHISRRDAEDRAERLDDPNDAAALLARAERINDPHLAQAIVRKAVDAGWSSVLQAYETEHPGVGAKLQSYNKIRQASTASGFTMRRAFDYNVR